MHHIPKNELNRIFLSLKETIKTEELLDDSIGFQELEQDSDQKNNPDLASIASQLDSNETLSLVDSDYDFCEEIQQAENDDDSEPLFLHFTCTVKSGIEYENISVKKLVPCIGKSVSHYGVIKVNTLVSLIFVRIEFCHLSKIYNLMDP